jgi:L-alanine-DL-glutamate epimerase-like enolase superfamily enzyme
MDLKAKHMELPLWAAVGGSTKEVLPAYNTDIGWLSIPDNQLVDGAQRVIEKDGFRGIKIKVGSANPIVDIKRIEKVRKAIGDNIMLAVDGNGKWICLPACGFAGRQKRIIYSGLRNPCGTTMCADMLSW